MGPVLVMWTVGTALVVVVTVEPALVVVVETVLVVVVTQLVYLPG